MITPNFVESSIAIQRYAILLNV